MKKLMLSAAIIGAASIIQAATAVNWSYTTSSIFDGSGTTAKVPAGSTAYLIQAMNGDTAVHTTAAFLTAFASAKSTSAFEDTVESWAADSTVLTAQYKISVTDADGSKLAGGSNADAYFVVFNGDNVYMSNVIDSEYSSVGGNDAYTFAWTTTQKDAMKASAKLASGGYQGAGWYKVEAVPEPTSGLLLVLGMCGLALRRRRA